MNNLIASPIRERKVRNGVIAYQYSNGIININGIKYVMHTMNSAIKSFRKNYPYKNGV